MTKKEIEDVRESLAPWAAAFTAIEIEAIAELRAVLRHPESSQSAKGRAAAEITRIVGQVRPR